MHYVYITAHHSGALEIGDTEDLLNMQGKNRTCLANSVQEPADSELPKLLYFERFQKARKARIRKEDIKSWCTAKLRELIDFVNPEWYDLASDRPQLREALFRY